jgi:hypothetical protein
LHLPSAYHFINEKSKYTSYGTAESHTHIEIVNFLRKKRKEAAGKKEGVGVG